MFIKLLQMQTEAIFLPCSPHRHGHHSENRKPHRHTLCTATPFHSALDGKLDVIIIVLLDAILYFNQVKYHLLVRVATDLLGELRALPPSSRPLGDPLEHDEFPSSPDPELELLLLLLLVYMREESWDPLGDGGNEEPKQGCVKDCRLLLEFSLYMDTGLVRLGEPPHDPMYDITPPSDEKEKHTY